MGMRNISEKLEENNQRQDLQGTCLSEAWEILTDNFIQLVEENVPVNKVPSAADHILICKSSMYGSNKENNVHIINRTKTTPSTKQQEIMC